MRVRIGSHSGLWKVIPGEGVADSATSTRRKEITPWPKQYGSDGMCGARRATAHLVSGRRPLVTHREAESLVSARSCDRRIPRQLSGPLAPDRALRVSPGRRAQPGWSELPAGAGGAGLCGCGGLATDADQTAGLVVLPPHRAIGTSRLAGGPGLHTLRVGDRPLWSGELLGHDGCRLHRGHRTVCDSSQTTGHRGRARRLGARLRYTGTLSIATDWRDAVLKNAETLGAGNDRPAPSRSDRKTYGA